MKERLRYFYKSAGSGLFSWKEHRELFLNGPCEIRVRDKIDEKELEYVHPSWIKSLTKWKDIDQKKNKKCVIL